MNKDLERLIDICTHYRGTIISKCIILEQEIENYIITYFIKDFNKFFDMHEVILNKLTFDAKIAVFQELLLRKHPDDFDKKYKKLISELRYLKDTRNIVAHYPMDMTYMEGDKVPKEFSLINYKNGTDIRVFSKGEFENFNKRLAKCVEEIVKLPT